MAKRDKFHEAVRNGLIADGWTITHDPYLVLYGTRNLQVDLGAEMPIGAEKEGRKIAVEIQTFVGLANMDDLYLAIGQYLMYKRLIRKSEPDRKVYLAVPDESYDQEFDPSYARDMREDFDIHIIVYNPETEEIVKWIE